MSEQLNYFCSCCGIVFTEEALKGNDDGLCPFCLIPLEVFEVDNFTPVKKQESVIYSPINNMIQFIKTYGQLDTWKGIEKYNDAYERIEGRKVFFQALKQLKLEFNLGEK